MFNARFQAVALCFNKPLVHVAVDAAYPVVEFVLGKRRACYRWGSCVEFLHPLAVRYLLIVHV